VRDGRLKSSKLVSVYSP